MTLRRMRSLYSMSPSAKVQCKKTIGKMLVLMLILISSAASMRSAFADTTTFHMNGKAAMAQLSDGSSYATVIAFEISKPTKITMLQFMLQDSSNGILIFEQKELASNEFSWNLGACNLDTEIAGFALLVEWKAITRLQSDHTNQKLEIELPAQVTLHLISTMIMRNAEATLSWNGRFMQGEGQIGLTNIVSVIHSTEEPIPPSPP